MAGFGSRFHWLRFRRIRGLGGGRLGYGRSELPGVNVGEPSGSSLRIFQSRIMLGRHLYEVGWAGSRQSWYVRGCNFLILLVFFFIAMEFHDMRNEVSSFFDVGWGCYIVMTFEEGVNVRSGDGSSTCVHFLLSLT